MATKKGIHISGTYGIHHHKLYWYAFFIYVLCTLVEPVAPVAQR